MDGCDIAPDVFPIRYVITYIGGGTVASAVCGGR